MTSLVALSLESCSLTDRFLDNHVTSAVRRSRLDDVQLGWNEWSTQALKTWLQDALVPARLKRISLAAPASDRAANVLAHSLVSAERCALQRVDLSHCQLTDAGVQQLACTFSKTPLLKTLILRNNPQLSTESLVEILNYSQAHLVSLEQLDLSGCSLRWASSQPGIVQVLESYLSWSKHLRCLSLSFGRTKFDATVIASLTLLWTSVYGGEAVVRHPTPHQLILGLAKH